MSSSSSLGNRDVIATTTDASQQHYQYNAYLPRQSDASLTSDTVPPSSNLLSGRAGSRDGIVNHVPSALSAAAAALNPEMNDPPSSSGLSLSGSSSLSGPALPVKSSKRWLVSSGMSRRLREFIPDFRKDQEYWQKRQKNNEAAKRSREKRRINDVVMGKRIYELSSENKRLRLELEAIKRHFGYPLNLPYPIDAVTLAASTAAGRPESPMMFAAMSSGDSDEDSESSQSRQVVVSGGTGDGARHGLDYHRQPSTQDSSPSSSFQLSNQHHHSSSEGAAADSAYLRTSNNTSEGQRGVADQSTGGYRQPHRPPQHYFPPAKNSDVHLSAASRHPSQESFSRFVPQSLDGVATPALTTQKMISTTTSKSSAALARAEVLERLAMSRAKQSVEQRSESSYERSSRRYEDRGTESYEYRGGQYYDRRSPSFRSASDLDSVSAEERGGGLMHDDSGGQGCVGGNSNNGAFITRDLNDESSWQLKHQPPSRRIKVETSVQSRWNDRDPSFSDVSSEADDARGVQFSVADRSRPPSDHHHRSEGLRGLRETPLNLTKRLRISVRHGAGAAHARIDDAQSMHFDAHDEEEMPPLLLMRSHRAMLSRSTSGDVKTVVPNVSPTSSSPTQCSSAPVPEFFLRSPLQQQLKSRTVSPHYLSSTSESFSSARWSNAARNSQNLPSSSDFAPLSLPNIGTLTPGSRARRYSQRADELPPHVVAQSHVISADEYSSEYSSSDAAGVPTRRRLKLEEDEIDAASKSMEVINRHVRGGVPLKVWHKRSSAHASDDWPLLLEDGRYDSLSPRLERHASNSEIFTSTRDSGTSQAETNYKPESPRRGPEIERNCSSKSTSQSDVRVVDNDLGSFVGGVGGAYRGGRERISVQAAVHLSTVALDELEGHRTGKQQQQQQENLEETNFDAEPH